LEHFERRRERDVVSHLLTAKHRHVDGNDRLLLHYAHEQVRVLRLFVGEDPLDQLRVVPIGQRRRLRLERGKQDLSVAVRDHDDAILAVLVEEARGHSVETLEIATAQRVGQREHLQASGHPPDLGIEGETDAADILQHALRRVPAVLDVIV
jgi:hypothetical protein